MDLLLLYSEPAVEMTHFDVASEQFYTAGQVGSLGQLAYKYT